MGMNWRETEWALETASRRPESWGGGVGSAKEKKTKTKKCCVYEYIIVSSHTCINLAFGLYLFQVAAAAAAAAAVAATVSSGIQLNLVTIIIIVHSAHLLIDLMDQLIDDWLQICIALFIVSDSWVLQSMPHCMSQRKRKVENENRSDVIPTSLIILQYTTHNY